MSVGRKQLSETYGNRRVLVTGHTGFKGAWLARWLGRLGATVGGLALAPDEAQRPLFEMISADLDPALSRFGDITRPDDVDEAFRTFRPDFVFHLAAQPLVRLSYEAPADTFAANVMGTVNVLDAVRRHGTAHVVCVTTDKCYENTDQIWPYREIDRMGGFDPYSASKGAAELAIASYQRSFFSSDSPTVCASARGGNVIGGGDLSADRLLPDLFRAMTSGGEVVLRNPHATRPWQHVLESLSGYLTLGHGLVTTGHSLTGGWNFGPDPSEQISVGVFVELMNRALGADAPRTVSQSGGPHEAGRLALDITKAAEYLHWRPVLSVDQRVELTAEWFLRALHDELDVTLLDEQIMWFEDRWLGTA